MEHLSELGETITDTAYVLEIIAGLIGAGIFAVLNKRLTWRILRVVTVWPLVIVSGTVFIAAAMGALILGVPFIISIMLAGKGDWLKNLSNQDKDKPDQEARDRNNDRIHALYVPDRNVQE